MVDFMHTVGTPMLMLLLFQICFFIAWPAQFVSKSKRSIVKIIDFGLSKKYLPEQDVLKEGGE
jgi:hypothetical protein